MGRSSLLLIGITLVCGTILGWSGALLINHFRNVPVDAETTSVETVPVLQQTAIKEENADSKVAEPFIPPETPPQTPQQAIVVSINGAVKTPGVYTFEEGARVQNGIKAAGGATEEADLNDINIAAKLMDNTSLYIPFQMFRHQDKQSLIARRTPSAAENNPARYTRSGWAHIIPAGITSQQETPSSIDAPASTSPAPTTNATPATGLINLNTATLDELQKLPSIGPKTAEKIDAYRKTQPFQTIDDLEAVNGIGPKTMEAVRDFVTVN